MQENFGRVTEGGGFHTRVRGAMFVRDGAVTPGPSRKCDITFFVKGRLQRIAKGAGGKGPRQKKNPKSVKKFFDTFRHLSRRAKNVKKIVKNCQKVF